MEFPIFVGGGIVFVMYSIVGFVLEVLVVNQVEKPTQAPKICLIQGGITNKYYYINEYYYVLLVSTYSVDLIEIL